MKKFNILFITRPGHKTQKGGDQQHLSATAKALEKLGHQVQLASLYTPLPKNIDLIHCFNLAKPQWILPFLKQNKIPVVVSSVFVDYSSTERQGGLLRKLITKILGVHALEYYKNIARYFKGQEPWPGWSYIAFGQRGAIKKVLQQIELLITASAAEYDLIEQDFGPAKNHLVLPLGHEHFSAAASQKPRKGVICAARIEPIKNQLALIQACQKIKVPLTLTGSPSRNHSAYYKKCLAAADEHVSFAGELSAAELAQALASHLVHALPSHYESTGLSTLEALKSGAEVVVHEHGITQELFGEVAHFCQPTNVDSIAEALQVALLSAKKDIAKRQKEERQAWLQENFSWQKAALQLEIQYTALCKKGQA